MRIALVTETFPPEINGVARTLENLVRGLVDRGHEVTVVRPRQPADRARVDDEGRNATPGPSPEVPRDVARAAAPVPWREELMAGLPIPLYPGLRFGLPAQGKLVEYFRRWRPEVVHIATEGPLGLSALGAATRLEIPLTSSFHTNFHQYGRYYGYGAAARLLMRYFRWFHNRTRVTLVPSLDVHRGLAQDGFGPLDLLSRGVDTRLFDPERRSADLRRSWGAGPDDLVVMVVGRLAKEKNPDLACRAFVQVRRSRPGSRTVVVGDGPAAAHMRRTDPQSHFCGMRRGEDLAQHYASADLLLFPSLTETFGNVLLEGLASGLPVVAFDYAAGALLTHGVDGFVAPFGDEERWLEAVAQASSLPMDELRRLGQQARRRGELETWEAIVARFEEQLTTAATHRSSDRRAVEQVEGPFAS